MLNDLLSSTPVMIDLHCHSHFSDGEHSPEALLKRALHLNVRLLALTDHDTTAGLPSLHQAACDADIRIINGIELSALWKKYDVHILGLNVNQDAPCLIELIAKQRERRMIRARQIAERLINCGVLDAYQKASHIAGHERLGRPHFAQVLINEGLASDMKTAFKRFLGRGRAAYVATVWPSLEETVCSIRDAGGDAVIAHPLKYGLTRLKLHELINAFKGVGGVGMEVVSGDMTAMQANELAGLCGRYDLLASTGSDYHGDTLSRVALGQQRPLPANCTPIWHKWNL